MVKVTCMYEPNIDFAFSHSLLILISVGMIHSRANPNVIILSSFCKILIIRQFQLRQSIIADKFYASSYLLF